MTTKTRKITGRREKKKKKGKIDQMKGIVSNKQENMYKNNVLPFKKLYMGWGPDAAWFLVKTSMLTLARAL